MGADAGLADDEDVALPPDALPAPPVEQLATAMAGQSTAAATNRRAEMITRHDSARPRQRGGLVGHCLWRLGAAGLLAAIELTISCSPWTWPLVDSDWGTG